MSTSATCATALFRVPSVCRILASRGEFLHTETQTLKPLAAAPFVEPLAPGISFPLRPARLHKWEKSHRELAWVFRVGTFPSWVMPSDSQKRTTVVRFLLCDHTCISNFGRCKASRRTDVIRVRGPCFPALWFDSRDNDNRYELFTTRNLDPTDERGLVSKCLLDMGIGKVRVTMKGTST